MSIPLLKKGDTIEWKRAVAVYNTVRELGDGCNTGDIALLIDGADLSNVSSTVSKLILCDPPILSSVRKGARHTELKVLRPLPDIIYDNPNRAKRTHYKAATSKAVTALGKLSRKELLLLKLEINKLLEAKTDTRYGPDSIVSDKYSDKS